ncbi:hypothetical protein BACCAP_02827 [Pseudoflavonifractor capillosus ATCC 29799]|uniref:Uncharacterized protein n=1 Tax=Pseudoflavonifractor capillosus ATCC 29799 TaxID=411467 RepID=A6NX82_9FIRM|nr:hypothetical protein BACCAP_02827 [Pseudoflavonifractor capillosus ATCC 29799]
MKFPKKFAFFIQVIASVASETLKSGISVATSAFGLVFRLFPPYLSASSGLRSAFFLSSSSPGR